MNAMAAKKRTAGQRKAPPAGRAASNGRPLDLHTPAETDPKKRVAAVRRAATRIKTTARIDTITLGRD
jgi:hypothetical protein